MSNFYHQLPREVLRSRRRHKLETGEVLFAEGTAANSLFYVESGCVRLVVHPLGGRPLVLYRARDLETFAEDQLLRPTYGYTAIADKPTVVWSVDRESVLEHTKSNSDTGMAYLSILSQRCHQLRLHFERLGLPSAKDKVLHLLSSLSVGNEPIDLSGRLKTLASDLNLTHETMYRALKALEIQGSIQRQKGWVTVVRE